MDLVNIGQTAVGTLLVRPSEVSAIVDGGASCLVVSGPCVTPVQRPATAVAAALGDGFTNVGADMDGRNWLVRGAKVTQLEAADGFCILALGPTTTQLASPADAVAAALGLSVG